MDVFRKSKMERTSFWFLSDMVLKRCVYVYLFNPDQHASMFDAVLSLLIRVFFSTTTARHDEYDSATLMYFYCYYY